MKALEMSTKYLQGFHLNSEVTGLADYAASSQVTLSCAIVVFDYLRVNAVLMRLYLI